MIGYHVQYSIYTDAHTLMSNTEPKYTNCNTPNNDRLMGAVAVLYDLVQTNYFHVFDA